MNELSTSSRMFVCWLVVLTFGKVKVRPSKQFALALELGWRSL